VDVVAGEDVGQPEGVPHLAEARVGVQEDAAARGRQQLVVGQEAHDVEQQVGVRDELQRVATGHAGVAAVAEIQRPRLAEAGGAERIPQPRHARGLRGRAGVQAVEEEHLVPEPAEAEQVLQELPGMAGGARLLGHGARHDDAAGVRSRARALCPHRRPRTSKIAPGSPSHSGLPTCSASSG
jgi:hypothetical protein